jgi:hypothetical protein
MPDTDPALAQTHDGLPFEPRNLPMVVPPPREGGDNWFLRAFRSLFGLRPSSIRSDLKDVLDAMTPGETGFSP